MNIRKIIREEVDWIKDEANMPINPNDFIKAEISLPISVGDYLYSKHHYKFITMVLPDGKVSEILTEDYPILNEFEDWDTYSADFGEFLQNEQDYLDHFKNTKNFKDVDPVFYEVLMNVFSPTNIYINDL
jgi:hypothetical protein